MANNNVGSSYDEAIKVYTNYLPQLQAKYNTILTQLSAEQANAQAQQGQLFGTQKTSLTNDIAKRGLTATAGDSFFDSQQEALAWNQNIQANDLLNKYAALRNDVTASQTADVMGINSAIAALQTSKSEALQAQKNWEKEQERLKKAAKQAQKNWEKEYKNAKSQAERDYLLKVKELTKLGSSQQDILDAYIDKLIDAYSKGAGDKTKKGVREMLRDQAIAAGLNKDIAQKYMDLYLPIGWEWGE